MRILLIVVLFLFISLTAFGQEKMSIGLGPEFNWNSRQRYAAGIPLYFGYNFKEKYKAGTIITFSNNFGNFSVIEPTLFIRRYFNDSMFSGFFVQADLGVFLIFESGEFIPMADAGARVGYRKFFGQSFFIDPNVRLGYPFGFGVGVIAGLCF
jgi:hypothetical protein